MDIIDDVKNMIRKTSNIIIDTAEELIDKPKSAKELAERIIEHLNHQEFAKIAEIMSSEVKKYATHTGLDNLPFINSKLDEFENGMNNLARDFEEGDYQHIAIRLNEIANTISEEMGGASGVFKTLKSFLASIATITEDYGRQIAADPTKKALDFSSLLNIFEEGFGKLITHRATTPETREKTGNLGANPSASPAGSQDKTAEVSGTASPAGASIKLDKDTSSVTGTPATGNSTKPDSAS